MVGCLGRQMPYGVAERGRDDKGVPKMEEDTIIHTFTEWGIPPQIAGFTDGARRRLTCAMRFLPSWDTSVVLLLVPASHLQILTGSHPISTYCGLETHQR